MMKTQDNNSQLKSIKSKKNIPVFVIGSARSGTSILSRLIRDYLYVSFGTESQFIIRFYKRLQYYGSLQNDTNLKKLLSDIGEERCFQRWKKFGYQIDLDRIYSRIEEKSYTGVLSAIFTDLAIHNGMARWGDKTPEYIYDLDILHELFPTAKFVHIVRDGRDVALSTFKTHFGAKNIGVAALEWNRQMACVSLFKKKVPQNQLIEIRYEDFLTDPFKIFTELISFLEIDDADGTIRAKIENNMAEELFRDNYYKWRTQLKKKYQILFEKVNYQFLTSYNYPTITDGMKKATSIEKFFWKFHHRAKQFMRIDTWKDNFYKLKVHLRHARQRLEVAVNKKSTYEETN